MKNKAIIELYAAVTFTYDLPHLEGIAVADAESISCKISGISVGFSGNPGAIRTEQPSLIVYSSNQARYLKNFSNQTTEHKTIEEAQEKGYSLYHIAKWPVKMPAASFALPKQSQKELAAEVAGWVGQNIETLVTILILNGESGSIAERDAYSVPPYFRNSEESLLHYTVNLSRVHDGSYKSHPDVTRLVERLAAKVQDAVRESPHTRAYSSIQRKIALQHLVNSMKT